MYGPQFLLHRVISTDGPSNLPQKEHPSAIGKHISSMAFNVSLSAVPSVPFTVVCAYVCVGGFGVNLPQGRGFHT